MNQNSVAGYEINIVDCVQYFLKIKLHRVE